MVASACARPAALPAHPARRRRARVAAAAWPPPEQCEGVGLDSRTHRRAQAGREVSAGAAQERHLQLDMVRGRAGGGGQALHKVPQSRRSRRWDIEIWQPRRPFVGRVGGFAVVVEEVLDLVDSDRPKRLGKGVGLGLGLGSGLG